MFEPLLLEECAAQMLRGQEEGQVLTSQPGVIAAAAPAAVGGSLSVRLTLPPGASSSFHENDVLLVSKDSPEVLRCAALCNAMLCCTVLCCAMLCTQCRASALLL